MPTDRQTDVCPPPRPTLPERHPATALLHKKVALVTDPAKWSRLYAIVTEMDAELWKLDANPPREDGGS